MFWISRHSVVRRAGWPGVLLAVAASLLSAGAQAWTSELLPYDEVTGRYEPAEISVGGRRWRLADYSFVGYDLSRGPLGNQVPCSVVEVDGQGDITGALQAAIHKVGRAGGGVVRIPAGTFTLSRSVAVPYDNVSVEGAGSARTLIDVPAGYRVSEGDAREGVFTIGRDLGEWRLGWWDRSPVLADVAGSIPEQSRSFQVRSARGLRVGQWVVAVQYFWPALVRANSGPEHRWGGESGWPAEGKSDRQFAFVYLRRITDISGRNVTVDAPFPIALDSANNPIRLRDPSRPAWAGLRANSGVSGLAIRFEDNSGGVGGRPGGAGGANNRPKNP